MSIRDDLKAAIMKAYEDHCKMIFDNVAGDAIGEHRAANKTDGERINRGLAQALEIRDAALAALPAEGK